MLLNFLKFGLRISLELPTNWWQNLYLSSKQATTVLILFQESSRNSMLLFTVDVASSLLSPKLSPWGWFGMRSQDVKATLVLMLYS